MKQNSFLHLVYKWILFLITIFLVIDMGTLWGFAQESSKVSSTQEELFLELEHYIKLTK